METVILLDSHDMFFQGKIVDISEIRNVSGWNNEGFIFHFKENQIVHVNIQNLNLMRMARVVEASLVPEVKRRFGAMAGTDDGIYNLKIQIIED